MMSFFEKVIVSIYHAFSKCRIYRVASRNGYRVVDFEWLPESDEPVAKVARITPTHDGFDHGGDDCPCNPSITLENDGLKEYTLIKHREMNADD